MILQNNSSLHQATTFSNTKTHQRMSRVHPQAIVSCSPPPSSSSPLCSSSSSSDRQETFTIWMKSLIFNGKGCTVFDSNGEVVYRVDNYNTRGSSEVFLMDSQGKVLCTILKKKFGLWASWEGYGATKAREGKPWFKVQGSILRRPWSCEVAVSRRERTEKSPVKMEREKSEKSACRIVDRQGRVVAEVKRKSSEKGIALGDDVLTMTVEPNVEHALVMGIVVSYGLICSTI